MNYPQEFTVRLGLDPDKVIVVTIKRGLHGVPFGSISSRSSSRRLLFSLEETLHQLVSKEPYQYHEIDYNFDGESIQGVLYCIYGNNYGCMPTICDDKVTNNTTASSSRSLLQLLKLTDIINNWKVNNNVELMKLPLSKLKYILSPERKKISPETVVDTPFDLSPLKSLSSFDYLQLRYYSTIYSLNTPLSYFLKTALPRFRTLVDGQDAIGDINKCIMSINDLDERHSTEGLANPNYKVNSDEKNHRDEFFQKHANKDSFLKMLTDLKIRETQLQMLLRLELVYNHGDLVFLGTAQATEIHQPQASKQLVRRKGRRIMPTFLGMGIGISEAEEISSSNTNSQHQTNRDCVNILIDRLAIWDTLYLTGTLKEFLIHVVVPYFHKKIPLTIKYIVDRFKGLNVKSKSRSSSASLSQLKSRSRSQLKSQSASESPSQSQSQSKSHTELQLQSQPDSESHSQPLSLSLSMTLSLQQTRNSNSHEKHHSKYNKTLMRQSLPSNLGLGPISSISLKRSKSNAASKNLEKRQVEVATSFSSELANSKLSLAKAQRSSFAETIPKPIFTIKRSKTTPLQGLSASGFASSTISSGIHSSMDNSKSISTFVEPQNGSISQVAQTPVKKRTTEIVTTPAPKRRAEVMDTPISQKLMALSGDVFSSPVRSPEKLKPGDPVSTISSPFYTSKLITSPSETTNMRKE